MSFRTRRCFKALLVLSLLIQMHIAQIGYAASGAKIAFTCWNDLTYEIYVMDGDGGNKQRLTNDIALDYLPSWSPDGKRIAFASTRDGGIERIFVMDSDGRNVMQLTEKWEDTAPAWSPDGAKIAFTRFIAFKYHIWVMDADGGNQIQLTHLGGNADPAWSPDGRRIAFNTWKRHEGIEIYVMDSDGNNQVRITHDLRPKDGPSWSPDGQRIAYAALHIEELSQIYVVEADGKGRTKRITDNAPTKWGPAWSPAGDTIAYVTAAKLDRTIELMTIDGQHLKQLSEDGASCLDPDWYAPVGWSVSPTASVVTIWGKIKTPGSVRR